jgi:hypothetical protein
LPTSLVAYYIELDSWKDVAVVKLEEPTAWEIWSERLQWVAIGASAAILTYAAVSD